MPRESGGAPSLGVLLSSIEPGASVTRRVCIAMPAARRCRLSMDEKKGQVAKFLT